MDQLAEMMVFAKVVEMKSFSAAADALHTSKSLISKQVSSLESTLGVKLLNRTTRRMSLTEIGSAYYQHCARIAQEIEAARETALQMQSDPRGILKITGPVIFTALHLSGAIECFLQRYPQVEIELDTSDRVVDLVDEGYDLAIRITNSPLESTISRKIVDVRWVTCAAPAYLAKHGEPLTPQDLLQHNCLTNHKLANEKKQWTFRIDGKDITVPVSGNCRVNSTEAMHQLAVAGTGLALFPTYVIGNDLQSGKLKQVLSEYQAYPNFAIYATYMPNRYMQTKVRAFIDHLIAYFGAKPQWDQAVVTPLYAPEHRPKTKPQRAAA
jgi:DNA-binding transcriptional LysR family regulator